MAKKKEDALKDPAVAAWMDSLSAEDAYQLETWYRVNSSSPLGPVYGAMMVELAAVDTVKFARTEVTYTRPFLDKLAELYTRLQSRLALRLVLDQVEGNFQLERLLWQENNMPWTAITEEDYERVRSKVPSPAPLDILRQLNALQTRRGNQAQLSRSIMTPKAAETADANAARIAAHVKAYKALKARF